MTVGPVIPANNGQEARILKGYSAGDICYGYGSRPTQIRMSGGREVPSHYEIYIIPEQAKIVRRMFDLKIKGLGFSAIAKYLNENNIPSTDRGKKISGKSQNWSSTAVRKILMREKYIGLWRWGKTSRIRNPDANKLVTKDQPQNLWVEHNEGKEIREDLIVVSIDKWQAVQKMIAKTTAFYREKKDKVLTMNEARTVAFRSGTLLAGILTCSECHSPMLQITGRNGGYYGCFIHHRKDNTKCTNKRLISRRKVESKVVEALKTALLEQATKMLNDMIRRRLRVAPEEIQILEKKKSAASKEIANLMKFVMSHGDISHTIKETLSSKEEETRLIDQRIKMLRVASADKLLVTPYSLKARYEKLTDRLQEDPVIANGALKPLFPQGLTCSPSQGTGNKNHNQHNSRWEVKGTLAVAAASGFSQLELGGPIETLHPVRFLTTIQNEVIYLHHTSVQKRSVPQTKI
jgi:hypothetical protein